jgi:hypothetical protein
MLLTASCLCGGVSLTATALGPKVTACHCGQCRKLSGHYAASFDVASAPVYTARATLAEYKTPGGGTRGFCATCGSSLWFRSADGDWSIEAGAVDGPTGGHLAAHIFTAFKGDYYDIADGAPQHETGGH